jgi:hypothetical protein
MAYPDLPDDFDPVEHYYVRPTIEPYKQRRFLALLAHTGTPYRAAKLTPFDLSRAYKLKKADPDFAAAWQESLEQHGDVLEQEALRRATEGVTKGIYHQGTRVDEERVYSDTLMALLLKGNKPEKFDRRQVELTGPGGGPVQIDEPPNQIARKIAFALAIGLRQQAAGEPPVVNLAHLDMDDPEDNSDLA